MTAVLCVDPDEAVAGITGSVVLIGGFRMAGMPVELIDALIHAESVTSPLEVCVLGTFPASTSGDS